MSIKMSTNVPNQVLTRSPKNVVMEAHKDANMHHNIDARSMSCALAKKAGEVVGLHQICSIEQGL